MRERMQGYVVAAMSVVPAVIIINQGGGGGSCGVPLLVQNFSKFTRLFIIAQTNKPPTHNTNYNGPKYEYVQRDPFRNSITGLLFAQTPPSGSSRRPLTRGSPNNVRWWH